MEELHVVVHPKCDPRRLFNVQALDDLQLVQAGQSMYMDLINDVLKHKDMQISDLTLDFSKVAATSDVNPDDKDDSKRIEVVVDGTIVHERHIVHQLILSAIDFSVGR